MSKHKITPRKRFGQHFLSDLNTLRKIVHAISPTASDHIVEIGPGQGALTDLILEGQPHHLDIIEIDYQLADHLKQRYQHINKINIIQADATKFDFSSLVRQQKIRIIGNLPYNVSTPLLFKVIEAINDIQDMIFLLQKEVVDRMVAQAGERDYSRLSVMLQYHCQAKRLFNVGPQVFIPPPKVDSSLVKLTPCKPPMPANHYDDFKLLVREAFNQRRKTLRNSLKPWFTETEIQALGIDPGLRPEKITLREFIHLANNMKK